MELDVRLLGPLEVRRDDVALDLGTPKQRTVLALLLLHANHPVTAGRVVEELWPGEAPSSAVANVTTYLSRLRRAVAGDGCALERRDGGYTLRVRSDAIDVHRFTGHAGRGDAAWAAGDPGAAEGHWQQALAIWRGAPFDGLPTGPELDAARAEWGERRLSVTERHARARLRLGRPGDVVAEMRRHTIAEPLRETGWLLLVAALWDWGHGAEALEAYERARAVLGEQLGVDPGPRLRGLHQAILADDHGATRRLLDDTAWRPTEEAGSAPVSPAPMRPAVAAPAGPAQLPLDVRGFTGRAEEVARLDAVLDRAGTQPTSVVISAVSGMAGVGKTALALHWAHRRRAHFPDGQLYVNLRGFDPAGAATSPAEAVRGFLDALGVPAQRIPADFDAQAALYRSLVAGRRMLIVLDNARDSEQARALLPGAPGCLVLVTSRSRLTGLVALDGAQPLLLDVLGRDEARRLLAHRLGEDRVAAEPGALDEIIAGCAGLPLALAIVAARAAINPRYTLGLLAGQLRAEGGGLDALAEEGLTFDVRAVFSWSYHRLSPAAARLFRMLGRLPTRDTSAPAAASLAGAPPEEVHALLAELAGANLVTEHVVGRFTQHDLLRAYAAELAATSATADDGRAALRRLLDHYTRTACAAAALLNAHRDQVALGPPEPGASAQPVATAEQALAWFAAERAALVAAVRFAAANGFDRQAWELAWAATVYFARQGHGAEWADTQHAALRAAIATGDRRRQAEAHRALLRAYGRMGRDAESDEHGERALALFAELGDARGAANTHLNFAYALTRRGRHRDALHHDEQALGLYRELGDVLRQAEALQSVGWQYGLLGDHRQNLEHSRRALAMLRDLGAFSQAANTLDSMGHAHHHLGNLDEAVACFEEALALARDSGDRYDEAEFLTHLGDTLHSAGRAGEARERWRRALAIHEAIGHPDAATVRARLGGR
ncbi:BTAD domain-containing putative transcriptional regulator [Dactylosporangium sp. NPDC048998]|uniref:AfsR/SARP family transcriptional regulator n=1 Tax=Dactylosporangium sp. NPDC048998 TaxID=3363976 RepID=UPI00371EB644